MNEDREVVAAFAIVGLPLDSDTLVVIVYAFGNASGRVTVPVPPDGDSSFPHSIIVPLVNWMFPLAVFPDPEF